MIYINILYDVPRLEALEYEPCFYINVSVPIFCNDNLNSLTVSVALTDK